MIPANELMASSLPELRSRRQGCVIDPDFNRGLPCAAYRYAATGFSL